MRTFALLALMGCGPKEFEGDDAGECSDAADNDRDGAYDCEDPDCADSPDCAKDTGGDDDDDTGGVTNAPEDWAQLVPYLFSHFADTGDAALVAGLASALALMRLEDLSEAPRDRPIALPVLDDPNLGGLTIPADGDVADQVRVAIFADTTLGLDDHRGLQTEANRVCIEDELVVWANRVFLSDESCWRSGLCTSLSTLTETYEETVLYRIWSDVYRDYRSVTFDDGGTPIQAIVSRAWIAESFDVDGGSASLNQLFELELIIAADSTTYWWMGTWIDFPITGIGDDAMENLTADGMETRIPYGEEFVAGKQVTCNNDPDLPKPDRD